MDTMLNLKAFVTTARTGNFSRAARELGVAPSVVTKRIDQLERQIGTRLFARSTRRVELTDAGRRDLPRAGALINSYDDTIAAMTRSPKSLEGHIRIKAPTTLTVLYLGKILSAFQRIHPMVSIDIVLIDRPVNPVEEGFDIALGAFSPTFGGVVDVPLCPLKRLVCAAPSYLRRQGEPRHPRDLVAHDCLTFLPSDRIWTFTSDQGPISVEVTPRLSANDGQVLLAAALEGNGIALLSRYIVAAALAEGRLVPVLPAFAVPDMWIKAVVPETKASQGIIRALLAWLTEHLSLVPADE